jgi:hypothetical protein
MENTYNVNQIEASPATFKQCPYCEEVWDSRDSFLCDPEIYLIGYQTAFKNLTQGLFYFNHSCKSTLAISVHEFETLHKGPVYRKRMTGLEGCPGYCLHKDNLDPCPAECECVYVRDILQTIINWKKEKN